MSNVDQRRVSMLGTIITGLVVSILGAAGFALFQKMTESPVLSASVAMYIDEGDANSDYVYFVYVVTNSGNSDASRCSSAISYFGHRGVTTVDDSGQTIPAHTSRTFTGRARKGEKDWATTTSAYVRCENNVISNDAPLFPLR